MFLSLWPLVMSGGRWLNKRRRRNYSHPTFSLRMSAENSRRCVRGGRDCKAGRFATYEPHSSSWVSECPATLHFSLVLLACLLQSKTRGKSPFFASKRNGFHCDFSCLALENERLTLVRPSKMSSLTTLGSTGVYNIHTHVTHTVNTYRTFCGVEPFLHFP